MRPRCDDLLLDAVPPQNLEAEQSTLGAMMIDGNALTVGCETLAAGDFYRDADQLIFKALAWLKKKNQNVDLVTVQEALKATNKKTGRPFLEDAGGIEYLMALIDSVPSAANIEYYAGIVREKAILRKVAEVGRELVRLAHGTVDDLDALLDTCEQRVMAVSRERKATDAEWQSYEEIGTKVFGIIEEGYRDGTPIRGLETGIGPFDKLICGLMPGDLIVMAGHPTTGKTALVQSWAHHIAKQGTAVALFELEQTDIAMGFRAIQQTAEIDSRVLRDPKFMPEEAWHKLAGCMGELLDLPIHVCTEQGLSCSQIAARARRAKQKWDIGLVIVDYLGLITLPAGENEVAQLGYACTALKNVAKELNVPLILIHHLNRGNQHEKNREPRLIDLRGSGKIEERADVVLFTHQPGSDKGEAVPITLIVRKVKNFPEGKVPLVFFPKFLQFEEASNRHEDE
jgi:replicative DNA helicase